MAVVAVESFENDISFAAFGRVFCEDGGEEGREEGRCCEDSSAVVARVYFYEDADFIGRDDGCVRGEGGVEQGECVDVVDYDGEGF